MHKSIDRATSLRKDAKVDIELGDPGTAVTSLVNAILVLIEPLLRSGRYKISHFSINQLLEYEVLIKDLASNEMEWKERSTKRKDSAKEQFEQARKYGEPLGSEDEKAIISLLGDTYGMVGGILRRADKPKYALHMYNEGLKWERKSDASTYNLSNSIVLSLLTNPKMLETSELKNKVRDLIKKVEPQVDENAQKSRSKEWWAWADLGQSYAILGNREKALAHYKDGKEKSNPTKGLYMKSIQVLEELSESLAGTTVAPVIGSSILVLNEYANERNKSKLRKR